MSNDLLNLLVGLRVSSRHSVVTEGESDDFQEKLYIETEIDEYLKQALLKKGEERWDLIVLGGNAGDGKSALIERIYSKLDKNILNNLKVNWDATHSEDPDKNQLDILGAFFSSFRDEYKDIRPVKTHLIAMNTGMIVSFFEQFKELNNQNFSFSLLKNKLYYYLDLINVLEESSKWRVLFINLDHRNLLTMNEQDTPSIFNRMLEKLNINNKQSFLYEAFQNYEKNEMDPIYFNLMSLSNPLVQRQIEKAIYKTVLKYDLHFTPRAAWDLLYHLITADQIHSKSKDQLNIKEIGNQLFFQYLFTYDGDHDILKFMSNSDPCLLSTQSLDSYVIQLSLQPHLDELDEVLMGNTPLKNIRDKVGEKSEFHATEYALFSKRRAYFFNESKEIKDSFRDQEQLFSDYEKLIQEYVTYGLIKNFSVEVEFEPEQLQLLIEGVREAIVITFGESNKKDLFQLQELVNSGRFRVLTKIELPDENHIEPFPQLKNQDSMYYKAVHYLPREVVLAFKNQSEELLGELTVDFGLFELLTYIKRGYNPSSVDLNRFHHFKFFCKQLFTKLAENSLVNSVTIHDRIEDNYINVKPPQGLLKKKFEVEKL
jgi:DNA phosphorothioation-dependent restriction protein DptF